MRPEWDLNPRLQAEVASILCGSNPLSCGFHPHPGNVSGLIKVRGLNTDEAICAQEHEPGTIPLKGLRSLESWVMPATRSARKPAVQPGPSAVTGTLPSSQAPQLASNAEAIPTKGEWISEL